MKTIACLLLALAIPAHAKVGPDLSKGSGVEFFTKLRMDYASDPKTEHFPAWNHAPELKALEEAYENGEVDKVIELADGWLKKCPVDADTHLRVAMCFKEKGNIASYNYHIGVFYGLLQSITAAGDGLTPETAFKVISVHEEYSLIQEIGGKVEQQSLVKGPCDKMEITRRNGEVKLTLYFDVSIPMKALSDELTPKK